MFKENSTQKSILSNQTKIFFFFHLCFLPLSNQQIFHIVTSFQNELVRDDINNFSNNFLLKFFVVQFSQVKFNVE